jgi:uncharacterized membrane protein
VFTLRTFGKHESGQLDAFALVRKATPDRVLEEIKRTGGKVLKTSLSHEDEASFRSY